jgi:hypothetical protein
MNSDGLSPEKRCPMSRGNRIRLSAAAAALALSLTTLTACSAGAGAAGHSGPTLAETKSPVQLLRNEAATRIPPAVIESVSQTADVSVACKTEAEDPKGLRRSWYSDVQVTVEAGSAWRVDTIVDDLAASFVDQGWVATPLDTRSDTHALKLTKKSMPSAIRITAHRPDPAATAVVGTSEPVTIDLALNGPCVDTDGAKSDAVMKLEAHG